MNFNGDKSSFHDSVEWQSVHGFFKDPCGDVCACAVLIIIMKSAARATVQDGNLYMLFLLVCKQ